MSKQHKERLLTSNERSDFKRGKADFNASIYSGQRLTDKTNDLPIKIVDAETYDYIATLREIYHSVESSICARRLALDCLDKHGVSSQYDNNIKPDR